MATRSARRPAEILWPRSLQGYQFSVIGALVLNYFSSPGVAKDSFAPPSSSTEAIHPCQSVLLQTGVKIFGTNHRDRRYSRLLGCFDSIARVRIDPRPDDTILTLGDHIDRGPDSRGVLELLLQLTTRCRLVPIFGDHEEMAVNAIRDTTHLRKWLTCGGSETLRSYGWSPGVKKQTLAEWIPDPHRSFLINCQSYHETPTHIFVHAGYVPELTMDDQPELALRWRVTDTRTAKPHNSGKTVVVGHTPQLSGDILDLDFLVCIDTNCARGGYLTAFDVTSRQVWQADLRGKLRDQ